MPVSASSMTPITENELNNWIQHNCTRSVNGKIETSDIRVSNIFERFFLWLTGVPIHKIQVLDDTNRIKSVYVSSEKISSWKKTKYPSDDVEKDSKALVHFLIKKVTDDTALKIIAEKCPPGKMRSPDFFTSRHNLSDRQLSVIQKALQNHQGNLTISHSGLSEKTWQGVKEALVLPKGDNTPFIDYLAGIYLSTPVSELKKNTSVPTKPLERQLRHEETPQAERIYPDAPLPEWAKGKISIDPESNWDECLQDVVGKKSILMEPRTSEINAQRAAAFVYIVAQVLQKQQPSFIDKLINIVQNTFTASINPELPSLEACLEHFKNESQYDQSILLSVAEQATFLDPELKNEVISQLKKAQGFLEIESNEK